METVLPMMGLTESFNFFVCSEDVGAEKPATKIFERAYQEAQFWLGPDLRKDEILHIGDSLPADFCGAKAFGFQALWLDRSGDSRVTVFQDWLKAPEYPGKCEADIRQHTIQDLSEAWRWHHPAATTVSSTDRAGGRRHAQASSGNGKEQTRPAGLAIKINMPAQRERIKYEVRSNRGRVMEQFDRPSAPPAASRASSLAPEGMEF
jgi:hypothetical protein